MSWNDEHLFKVAERNKNLSEMEFNKYMKKCGWNDIDIYRAWQHVKRIKGVIS